MLVMLLDDVLVSLEVLKFNILTLDRVHAQLLHTTLEELYSYQFGPQLYFWPGQLGKSCTFFPIKEFGRCCAVEAQQEFCFLWLRERDPLSRNSAHLMAGFC